MSTEQHDRFADELVLYALGEVPASRCAEFQAHLASCSACREEFAALQADMAAVALTSLGPAPPLRARARLLAALSPAPSTPVLAANPWRWAFAAAAILALVFAGGAARLWVQFSRTRLDLANAQQTIAAQARNVVRAQEIVSVLTSPAAQHVTLLPANARRQPSGRIFYVKEKGQLVFFASNFEPLAPEQVYELWLITPAGDKIPAGLFRPDARGAGAVMMPTLPAHLEAKAFAITVEPSGGSEAPTSTPILLGL